MAERAGAKAEAGAEARAEAGAEARAEARAGVCVCVCVRAEKAVGELLGGTHTALPPGDAVGGRRGRLG